MTYKEQLQDPRWQKKRLHILERDNWTCQVCWDNTTQLHVHHKYYHPVFRAWEHPDDALITLCKDCHLIEEYIKKEDCNAVISVKKYHPKENYKIVCTIVNDASNSLSLSIFKITAKQHLIFIINHKDTSKYSMMELLNNAKKLI